MQVPALPTLPPSLRRFPLDLRGSGIEAAADRPSGPSLPDLPGRLRCLALEVSRGSWLRLPDPPPRVLVRWKLGIGRAADEPLSGRHG